MNGKQSQSEKRKLKQNKTTKATEHNKKTNIRKRKSKLENKQNTNTKWTHKRKHINKENK